MECETGHRMSLILPTNISWNSVPAQLVLGPEVSNYYFHTDIREDAEDADSEWLARGH